MFVKATSKQRYGDIREPYINVDHIVTAEIGHEDNVNVKLANNEEMTVTGERARQLLAYLEQHQLK